MSKIKELKVILKIRTSEYKELESIMLRRLEEGAPTEEVELLHKECRVKCNEWVKAHYEWEEAKALKRHLKYVLSVIEKDAKRLRDAYNEL